MSETDVSEDNSLAPAEKQVSITATKAADEMRVHSEVASVTRRLLNHSETEVEHTREEDGAVVAVTATIPVRYVSIACGGRSDDTWSGLVSDGVFDGE